MLPAVILAENMNILMNKNYIQNPPRQKNYNDNGVHRHGYSDGSIPLAKNYNALSGGQRNSLVFIAQSPTDVIL